MNRDAVIMNSIVRRHIQREFDRCSGKLRLTLSVYKTLSLIGYASAAPDVKTIRTVYKRLNSRWGGDYSVYGLETAGTAVRMFLVFLKRVIDSSHHANIDRLVRLVVVDERPVSDVLEEALTLIPYEEKGIRRFVRWAIEMDVTNAQDDTTALLAALVFRLKRNDWVDWVVECLENETLN